MTDQATHALVDVDGVEKVFHRGSEDIHVLKDLHLKVPAGRIPALMGPSGSGKSTLLNLIGGLDRPTRAGEIAGSASTSCPTASWPPGGRGTLASSSSSTT